MSNRDWGRLLLLSLLWGGSFFFVAVALRGLPVLSVVWGRVALGAVLLGLALRLSGASFPRGAVVWRSLVVMGIVNNVIPFTLFVLAQGRISGSMAAILNATTPLWGVVLAHLFTADEKITPAKALGLTFGLAGVVVMMGGVTTGDLWASLACLLAAFSYGLAGLWGRRFHRMGVAPMTAAFGQVTASAVILTPLWLLLDQPWRLPVPEAEVLAAVLGIASLSTALAYVIVFRLLASAGATNLLLVTFLIPVSATLLGVGLLGDRVQLQHIAGFGLIAAGLAAIDGRIVRAWQRRARAS